MAALATVRQRTVSSRDVSTATKHSQGGAEPTKAKETLMAELLRAGERRGASATEVAEIAGALLSELDRDSPPEGARGRGALTTANLARRRQSRACLVFALVMRFALLVCKAVWLTLLAIAAFALACWLSPSLLFFVSKHMHSRMHHVVFALRRVLVSAVPLWAWLNLDPTQPCMVENALLDPSQLCPCLHVAKATEGYLADDSGLLPHEIFKKDDHFYVFRDVLEIDRNFGLSAFQNHHKVHGENPQSCLEVGSSYDVGPKFYHQLFDQSFMEEALESNTSWSFTWMECPSEHTFKDLLPKYKQFLPHGVQTTGSIFSVSKQWGEIHHLFSPNELSDLVMVAVLEGEGRMVFRAQQLHCLEVCPPPSSYPTLSRGDLVIFNQKSWTHTFQTWSNFSIIHSTGLEINF